MRAAEEEANALVFDGWNAVRNSEWCCEAHRLRDETGQLRGHVQVRYGVVRAVAAQPARANNEDPLRGAYGKATCRGQIVVQEKTAPMGIRFAAEEREGWIRAAIEAIRATPQLDQS